MNASQLAPSAYATEGLQQLKQQQQQQRLAGGGGASSPDRRAAAAVMPVAPLAAGAAARGGMGAADQHIKAAGVGAALRSSVEGWSIPAAHHQQNHNLPHHHHQPAGANEAADEVASLRASGARSAGAFSVVRTSAEGAPASAPAPPPPPPFSWTKGEQIGAGAFGRVYSGLNNETGEMIAIKQVS